ncbi:MAG: magnesium/cobalt transporter CorA [Desulfatibacillaceae bacterium]|nr:magnesium/cobalt transporter CorA [Desulfatibacillaceae bacterium]
MSRLFPARRKKAGLAPGSLVHVGEALAQPAIMESIVYNEAKVLRETLKSPSELPLPVDDAVTWIHVNGVHDVEAVRAVGEKYGLHPLMLEDIVNTTHRPKAENYDNCLFVILKTLEYNFDTREIKIEQISFVIGKGFVLVFSQGANKRFEAVIERINSSTGRIRRSGADYLAYALIDLVVDHYFAVLEPLGEDLEALGEQLLENPDQQFLVKLKKMKNELLAVRRFMWPAREAVGALMRRDSPFMGESVSPFMRDVYDHTVSLMETVETFRELLSGTLDLYLNSLSNRMNQVMKVLTIIATIFIPNTFIAGVYGMNFHYMPELEKAWAYPAVLGVMAAVTVAMLLFFRKRGWI